MTLIMGYKDGDDTYLSADKKMVRYQDFDEPEFKMDKIIHLGRFVLGFAGRGKYADLLRAKFDPPPQKKNQIDIDYLNTDVAEHIWDIQQRYKFDEPDGEMIDLHLLLVYNGNIYIASGEKSFSRCDGKYTAIGSGVFQAYTALDALEDYPGGLDPFKDLSVPDKLRYVNKVVAKRINTVTPEASVVRIRQKRREND